MNPESQTRRFDDMLKQIDLIARKQENTSKNVYEILAILRGDDFADGMVKVVKEHENRLKKLEDTNKKLGWTIGGALVAGGYGLFELLRKLFPFLVIMLLFTSCHTFKKREDAAHRFIRENPTTLAKLAAGAFPVTAKPGITIYDTTRIVIRDSVICPDNSVFPCPPITQELITGTRVDTVPDLAKIFVLESRISDLELSEARLLVINESLSKQSKNRLFTSIGLGAALLLCLYLLFRP